MLLETLSVIGFPDDDMAVFTQQLPSAWKLDNPLSAGASAVSNVVV